MRRPPHRTPSARATPLARSPLARAARLGLAGGMAAVVVLAAGFTGPATAATSAPPAPTTTVPIATGVGPTPSGATLRLASQTSWVSATAPRNVFDLRVVPHVRLPASDVELDVEVYNVLGTRSQFARSLTVAFQGYIIAHPIRKPLGQFTPDQTGAVEVAITVGREVGQLHLTSPGVYPVAVQLRPTGGRSVLAGFMTHLLYMPSAVTGPKLDVAWVLPVSAPPADLKRGTLPGPWTRSLTDEVDALAAYPQVPVTLQPTPDTISTLAATDPAVIGRLAESLGGREVLATTWVPMPLSAMLVGGLGNEVSLSLAAGADAVSADVGGTVAGQTWVHRGPIDEGTLDFLRGSRFQRVVLPESDLDPNPFRLTMAQPFDVVGPGDTLVRAAVADAGLQAHFTDQPDPVLAAHQLLADLVQVYEDAPANRRGVVVVTPESWMPQGSFLNAVLTGLADSPVLDAQPLDAFFDGVPAATGRSGRTLTRQLVIDEAAIHAAADNVAPAAQLAARRALDALASSLTTGSSFYPRLQRMLLEVPSSDLSPAERGQRLAQFEAALRSELQAVQLPGSRTITLTARRGQLPLSVLSQSDDPLKVLLRVQSDKLLFPGQPGNGQLTIPLELHKGNNLDVLTVEARTSGAFPLHVAVLTADGSLMLTKTSFTVQSTALSGVGVILSVGAALFLVIWWGRHAWRARRRARSGRGSRRHARGRFSGADNVSDELVSAARPGGS